MNKSPFVFGLAVFFLPFACLADGMFFWSGRPFGGGAQPGETVSAFDFEFDAYLYYRPGTQDLNYTFDFDLKFPFYEVLSAEILEFETVLTSNPGVTLGGRWNVTGDIVINGDSITDFSGMAGNGITAANDGSGVFLDLGYDATADAFIFGKVRLRGVGSQVEYSSVSVVSFIDSEFVEVFPEFQNNVVVGGECFLDPPYGVFPGFQLSPDDNVVFGLGHCTSEPFDTCDGTVWNSLIPESDGVVTCNTFGSNVNTQLEIYTGNTFSELELIGFNDDAAGLTGSRISFPVEQGISYNIRIVSNPVEFGNVRLDYQTLAGATIGDLNSDGFITLLDVAPFVAHLSNAAYDALADINQDGDVNLLDVQPFVDLISN